MAWTATAESRVIVIAVMEKRIVGEDDELR